MTLDNSPWIQKNTSKGGRGVHTGKLLIGEDASFLGDHPPCLLLAWNHLVLSKLSRRVEAAKRLNSYRFFENQKLLLPSKGGGSVHPRDPGVVRPAGPVSSPRLVRCLAPVLLGPERFWVPGHALRRRALEVLWALARGKSKRAGEEEVVGVGGGSRSWEGWGYRGRDVAEENPNPKEAKARWCCCLWDDLLNSGTLLPVTLSRGILTKKHPFEIKDWNWRGKDTSSGL